MGWNEAYTLFEKLVITTYDAGKLDVDLLSILMEPFRGTDIDSGGSYGLTTKDGKGVQQVCGEIFGFTFPAKPTCDYYDDPDAWDIFSEAVGEAFIEISKVKFGWC